MSENKWDVNFELLQEFNAEYKRFPLQNDMYHGTHIGNWCTEQRRLAKLGKLSPERLQKLENIDFFKSNTNDIRWEIYFSAVQNFYAEYGYFPKDGVIYQGLKIGKWCANQKLVIKSGKYPINRLKKLQDLGLLDTTREARWAHNFALLQEFVEEYKRFPRRNDTYKGINLGVWCAEQKRRSTVANYPVERLQKLTAIGLI